jgi:tetratricopeptide (TPR) repeat protein
MSSQRTSDRPPSHTAFVGRARELAELRSGLDDLSAGHGRLFLVSGEPGVGKTRLAEEISNDASARGMRVFWGRCWEGGGAPAYWPIIQVIRACSERPDFAQLTEALGTGIEQVALLVPEIVRPASVHGEGADSQRIDPEQARFILFDSVSTLLKSLASREPMVVVIDDLHDADAAALQMLRFLARSLRNARILLIGTHREAEVERSPELRSLIAELAREGDQLPLSGFSLADTEDLVRARTGIAPNEQFIATLHDTTGGNPLFLNGVVQMLASEGKLGHQERLRAAELKLPANVRGAIRARLKGISNSTNAILAVASAFGIEFDFGVLRRVAEISADELRGALDEAASAGLIISRGAGRCAFSHALIRGVLYGNITSTRRIALHARIGEVLEEEYASHLSAPHLSELAHHFAQAAPGSDPAHVAKAIAYLRSAGQAAETVCACQEAIERYEAGAELAKGGGESTARADLLGLAGVARLLSEGLSRKGIEECEQAIAAFERLGLDERAARVHSEFALQLCKGDDESLMDIPRAMFHFEKAARTLERNPESASLAWLYFGSSVAAGMSLDVARGLEASQRALEVGHRLGLTTMEGYFVTVRRSLLAYAGRIAESLAPQSAEMQPTSDPLLRIRRLFWLAENRWRLCRPGEAKELLLKGLAEPAIANVPIIRRSLLRQLAIVCLMSGELEQARSLVDEVRDRLTSGAFALHAGDWTHAQPVLEEALSKARASGVRKWEADLSFWYARLLRVRGDHARASAFLEDALRAFGDGSLPLFEMWIRPEFALVKAEEGNTAEARTELTRCRNIMAEGEDWSGLEAAVVRAEAVVAAAEHRFRDAEAGFERAIGIFERYSVPWEEAETLYHWGRALADAGENGSANEKFDSAIDIYRRIGAGQPWTERVLVEKARVTGGPPVHQESSAGSECVFRREGEYWTVVYQGKTWRLKDAKGLHYIAHLLAQPGEQIRALELVARIGTASAEGEETGAAKDLARSDTVAGDLGHAGEVLDAQAKSAYQRRLRELREELEEARELGNEVRAEQAEAEIEALAHELKSAVGLGGRDRRAASSSERARIAVTRAIRLALGKIADHDAELGKLLSTTIRTGTVCSYAPDHRFPVSWKL